MKKTDKIIENLPIGKNNPIHAPELEKAIGNTPVGTNNDTSRSDIANAIHEDNIPIGSNKNGYWLIHTEEEYQEIKNSIESKIKNLQNKQKAIENGWKKRKSSLNSNEPWPK